MSRLVQIREYLKQAYSMLATLQTSNDLVRKKLLFAQTPQLFFFYIFRKFFSKVSYSNQMNKLHSLIDHLKDQEKGYMDLLNSFIKFQQMAGNYATASDNQSVSSNNGKSETGTTTDDERTVTAASEDEQAAAASTASQSETASNVGNNNDDNDDDDEEGPVDNYAEARQKYQRDILDLSELNESIYQQQQLQQQLQQRLSAIQTESSSLNSQSLLSNKSNRCKLKQKKKQKQTRKYERL